MYPRLKRMASRRNIPYAHFKITSMTCPVKRQMCCYLRRDIILIVVTGGLKVMTLFCWLLGNNF